MLLDLWNSFWPNYFPYYRATKDAEQGIIQDNSVQNYLVCWLIDRAVKDREANS